VVVAQQPGIAMRANTAEVAVEAPETAAKPAAAEIVPLASPPGIHPSQARAQR
jgi:hypothetical protein